MTPYAVVVIVAARDALLAMDHQEREELTEALRQELSSEPASEVELPVAGLEKDKYYARGLSTGHVAVYRRMTQAELGRLPEQLPTEMADAGFVLFDILPSVTAVTQGIEPLEASDTS